MAATTINEALAQNAERHGDKVWLTDPETGKRVTWGEAHDRGMAAAGRLAALGAGPGESVAIASPNSIGSVMAFLGAALAGCRATPMNLVAGERTMAYVLGHSSSRLALVDDSVEADMRRALEVAGIDIPIHGIDPDYGPDLPESTASVPDFGADATGLLMYTSGTTGNPKGVMLSHSNLLAAGRNVVEAHAITTDDTGLCVLPIYHINGLCVTVMGSIVSASGLVMPERFSQSRFWNHVGENGCSWFSAVPTLFSYILNDDREPMIDRERLRFARSASAPLPPDIHRRFEERFGIPIIETMGLTETGAQILSNPMPPGVRKIGSPGIAFGNEVGVVDPETLKERPRGEEGEIVVRGANVMQGYLNQPEETANTITPDSWLRTGDLGRMDEDGYVFVTGRIKELIIKGGENIAPREIDEVLLEHPAVLEAAAFARPCDDYGQRVEACIRLKDGGEMDHEALMEHCHERLGPFKSPDAIHCLDELPKGPSGKVQRLKLIDLVGS